MSETPIPTAIRKAEERAQALHAEQKQRREMSAVAAQQSTPPQGAPPAQPQPTAEQPPAQQPVIQQPPLQPANPEKTEDAEYWRQRASTLAGMVNAKDREYQDQRQKMQAQMDRLQASVERLTASLSAAEQAATMAKQTEMMSALATEYDESDPLRQIVTQLSEQNIALQKELSETKASTEKLATQVTSVAETQTVSAEETFWADLEKGVPDRAAIEQDAAFIEFMYSPEPDAHRFGAAPGTTRQDLLRFAMNRWDAKAVIHYYDEWRRLKAQQPQPPAPDTPPAYQQSGPGPGNGQDAQKKMWTASEVRQFYHDWKMNRIPDAEAEVKQRDIQAAAREGRYQPGV